MNSKSAAQGWAPWTVAVVIKSEGVPTGQYCDGTLIAPDRVATASHCIQLSYSDGTTQQLNASDIEILANHTALDPAEDPGVTNDLVPVSSISLHPSADGYLFPPHYDVALLTLSHAVINPKPVALVPPVLTPATPPPPSTAQMKVSGWGLTDNTADFGYDPSSPLFPADDLQMATVFQTSDAACQADWANTSGPVVFTRTDMICAEGVVKGTDDNRYSDACGGDSGGPLVQNIDGVISHPEDPSHYQLAGVVSWGSTDCGVDPNEPGVYARVSEPSINNFLNQTTNPNPDPVPAATTPVQVTGTGVVGSDIACTTGGWTGDPTSFDYTVYSQHPAGVRADGSPILSTPTDALAVPNTNGVHQLTASELGNYVSCKVVAHGAGGSATTQSTALGPVTAVPATPTPAPAVARDLLAPALASQGVYCTSNACVVSVLAKDVGTPISGVATVSGKLARARRARCVKKHKSVACIKTTTVALHAHQKGSVWKFTARNLAAGVTNRLYVTATDKAGNTTKLAKRLALVLKTKKAPSKR